MTCIRRPPCGADDSAEWASGWHGFAFPAGVRASRNMSCNRVPSQLGVDHAWLPVTWTREIVPARGTFFYFMPGCSDFAWNVGRTLLVRNKMHAAVALQQRNHPNASWAGAVRRVAAYILQHPWREVDRSRVRLTRLLRRNASHEDLVHETALGVYDDADAGCIGVFAADSDPSHHPRARALAPLVSARYLDAHNEMVAKQLHNSQRIDTVQFSEQTQGGAHLKWFVEIWDTRSLPMRHGRPHAMQDGNGLFGRLDGTTTETRQVHAGTQTAKG